MCMKRSVGSIGIPGHKIETWGTQDLFLGE
jgi:hypothetical protein